MLLRLSCWLALAFCIINSVQARALLKRDADFESVRTRLEKDHSGKAGDPVDKYFREFLKARHEPGLVSNISGADEST